MPHEKSHALCLVCLIGLLFLPVLELRRLHADNVQIIKPSEVAPAKDLVNQVDYFINRLEQSLSAAADFDGARQSRTWKDANTLAVLALMLAMHDEEHALKAAAPSMLRAARELAIADNNFAQAQAVFTRIKAARLGAVAPAAPAKWEQVSSLVAIMKQVPLIHDGLKRGIEPERLARHAAQSAGQSAALAAIAQTTMFDTERASTPADAEKWKQFCAQMRDAAGSVNSAVHAQDPAAVTRGMARLAQSCETCHAAFRQHP